MSIFSDDITVHVSFAVRSTVCVYVWTLYGVGTSERMLCMHYMLLDIIIFFNRLNFHWG
ncbi:hypothetical protein BDV38DRAFT_236883, partial [Aspergillus pseudotamarii]